MGVKAPSCETQSFISPLLFLTLFVYISYLLAGVVGECVLSTCKSNMIEFLFFFLRFYIDELIMSMTQQYLDVFFLSRCNEYIISCINCIDGITHVIRPSEYCKNDNPQ